jgi:hypothetical protein
VTTRGARREKKCNGLRQKEASPLKSREGTAKLLKRVQKLVLGRSKCIRQSRDRMPQVPGDISMALTFPCGGTRSHWKILANGFLSHSKE